MKTLFLSALIYYVSWIPWWFVKSNSITILYNGVEVLNEEIMFLAHFYFPLTLLSFFPVLVWLVANRNKKIRKLEQKLENTEQLLSETEAKLEKKERIKYGSLTGFVPSLK
jgi:uncharacterized membrane protein